MAVFTYRSTQHPQRTPRWQRRLTRRASQFLPAAILCAVFFFPITSLQSRSSSPATLTVGSVVESAAPAPPPIIDGPYLFLDKALIDEALSSDLDLMVHPPEIRQRVIIPDKPWEAMGYHYWSQILEMEDGYRLYYRRLPVDDTDTSGVYCFAHSSDGVNWTKPLYPASKFHGLNTNCTENGFQYVFFDPNSRSARPFKKLGHLDDDSFGISGSSTDGIDFVRKQVLLLPFFVDSQNVAIWDDSLEKYVFYLRGRIDDARTVVRGETADLDGMLDYLPDPDNLAEPGRNYPPINTELPVVFAPDSTDWQSWQDPRPGMVDIYHNAAFKYPWARNVYLAFPDIYYHYSSQTTPPGFGTNDGEFDVQLGASRDGASWTRYRSAYIARGILDGTQMVMMSMGQGMIRRGNELYQYFIALPRSHGFGADFDGKWRSIFQDENTRAQWMSGERGGVYLAVSQLHRFVSLRADDSESVVTTKPFVYQGNRLTLNFQTDADGVVCVALLDKAGKEIPGRRIEECDWLQGDSFDQVVSWQGQSDLSAYSGETVRLRFRFHSADVFAFEFDGDPYGKAPLEEQWREDFEQGYGQLTEVTGRNLWSVVAGRLVGAFDRDGVLKERARLLEQPVTERDAFAFQFDFHLLAGQRVPDASALVGLMGDGRAGRNPLFVLWLDNGGRRWGISAGADASEQRLGKESRISPDLGLWPNEGDWIRARLVWNPETQTATVTLSNLTEGWRIGSTSAVLDGIHFTLDRAGVRMDMAAHDPDLVLEMDNMVFERAHEDNPATATPTLTSTPTPSPSPTSSPTATATETATATPSPTATRTATPTASATATPTPTATATASSTATATPTPIYLPMMLRPVLHSTSTTSLP